ncbi:MAG: sialic acid synthase, partial [Actinomycetota bacterium]|nr:sialic acid synthase [Actinomycetota bacterium]
IAEIGCNHGGDLAIAKKMIAVGAQFCEVDAVKFQKRDPRALLSAEQYDAPHPNPMHAFGDTYGAHREFLEFGVEQHRLLQQACTDAGVAYSTSVWDVGSARSIIELDPPFLKIPSAANLNEELLKTLCLDYGGDVHLSLGMTTRAEEEAVVNMVAECGAVHRLVLYACTAGYPVPFEDVALLEIERLRADYGSTVQAIGFSGHHLGIAADVAALALGATHFERHFTLDRTSKGTDHAASLEPDGMRRLARDLGNVTKALTRKEQEVLPIEAVQRAKLKWVSR